MQGLRLSAALPRAFLTSYWSWAPWRGLTRWLCGGWELFVGCGLPRGLAMPANSYSEDAGSPQRAGQSPVLSATCSQRCGRWPCGRSLCSSKRVSLIRDFSTTHQCCQSVTMSRRSLVLVPLAVGLLLVAGVGEQTSPRQPMLS